MMVDRIAAWALRMPKRVAGIAALVAVAAAIVGVPVAGQLSAGEVAVQDLRAQGVPEQPDGVVVPAPALIPLHEPR